MDEKLNRNIAAMQAHIDLLQNLPAGYLERYKGRDSTELVAIAVKCHYRYILPGTTAAKERTDMFILSPDGKKVLEKEKSRE